MIECLLKNSLELYTNIIITDKVPMKLVNIFRDTNAPSVRFGGKTENKSTKNPDITTTALNRMALPVCFIVR